MKIKIDALMHSKIAAILHEHKLIIIFATQVNNEKGKERKRDGEKMRCEDRKTCDDATGGPPRELLQFI